MGLIFSSLRKHSPLIMALALLSSLSACGGRTSLFEEEVKPEWKERELALPSWPAATDLIPVDVSAAATTSFFIDEKSLSLADDGIVRYTLVARAAGGAENVSYEGIRCETAERKLYAIGRGKGEWALPRSDAWQRIVDNAFNRQHAVLAKDFFCPPGSILPTRDEIVEALRKAAKLR
jgi:hypothetical protein